jgi:hypothetical protein
LDKHNIRVYVRIFLIGIIPNDNSGGKVLILNGTFTQSYSTASVQEFKDSVYKWNDINWEINIKHENNNPPIITKSNFRVDNSMVFGMVVIWI